ncbi:MAG: DUF4270 family protein [Chitinophagaceae bacterium]|nr:MAG: DUF4270 family protein [Chitinophagaceae bacterium]
MKIKGLPALLSLIFLTLLFSCTKVNEATELGDELIPAVDNVNTFDTTLIVQAAYYPFEDSSRHLINENMALGQINDPAFGATTADMFFNLSSRVYGSSPFKDTIDKIDSVVLSVAFRGSYGDTLPSNITVQVSEINDNSFVDTALYRFDNPGFNSTAGIGTSTFNVTRFRDSIRISPSGKRTDSAKVANVLRIKLNNSVGQKLAAFDTSAYRDDPTFRTKFRGLAIKTSNVSGSVLGALAYFNLTDANTALLVYYQSKSGATRDTSVATFIHNANGQANSVRRTASGEYLTKTGQSNSQKLYIQSSPRGSYIGIKIPELSSFPNKVIHRAELIAYSVPADNASGDARFVAPNRLFLDHKGENNSKDSAYFFDNDIQPGIDGSLDFTAFGGSLRSDQSYRFKLTRYVQGIVTRGERNDSLRLFAPLRANVFARSLNQVISVPNLDFIAKGRVVIANGNYPDPTKRLRLRIIYSNL